MSLVAVDRARLSPLWAPAVLAGTAVAGLLAARSPFLLAAVLLGGLLLAAVFIRPLLVLGIVLLLGPMDLSALTGGSRGLVAAFGGLDMNGIRLLGVCFGLGATALVLPHTRAVLLGRWGLAYVAFLLWCVFALVRSPNLVDGVRLWLHIAYPLLVFVTIVGLVERQEQLDRLIDYALVGAALIVFVLNPIFTLAGGYEIYQSGLMRVRGVGSHENPVSFYLLAVLYIAFARLILRRQWRYLLLSAGLAFWLVLTLARVTFVSALFGLGAMAIYAAVTMRSPRVLVATVVTAVALGVFVVPPLVERSLGVGATPAELIALVRNPVALYETVEWQGRELAWPIVYSSFRTQPGVGHGLGSSVLIMRQHFPPEVGSLVHNDYLRVAVETGMVGFLLFGAAMLSWLLVAVRADRLTGGTAREYALPALAALLSWGTIALTDNPFNAAPFTQTVALLVGASAACVAMGKRKEPA